MAQTQYGDFIVEDYVSEADFKMVDFDPKDLDTAFARNPSTITYFGHLLGRARRQVANYKTRRDAVFSKLSKIKRDEIVNEGGKPTEARIEEAVRKSKEFIQVSFAANHALEVETTIEALYWAARGRRQDMEFFAEKQRNEMGQKAYTLNERAKKFASGE